MRLLLLLLLPALALLLAPHAAAATVMSAADQMRGLCGGFRVICAFVARSCDPTAGVPLDAKCLESFQLYYEHSHTLSSCASIQAASGSTERQEEGDGSGDGSGAAVASARAFLARYSAWQTTHVCELFHATEAKAARTCSRFAGASRPWRHEAWPLYCRSVFAAYKDTRHQIDALCARTSHSDAFWEAFAEFSASDTCAAYYDRIRTAAGLKCGDASAAAACTAMFEWYAAHQREIERDCLELRVSKPFYRGFYQWKKKEKKTAAAHLLRH